jgi:hypothetical protein
MQKQSETKIRKLPLPLRFKLGVDGSVSDGLFTLTSKEASEIGIISIDGDGYVSLEIHPPAKENKSNIVKLKDLLYGVATQIGLEASKSRGQSKEFGQYKYYRRPDGTLLATVIGGARDRTFCIGNIKDRSSIIFQFAVTIVHSFGTKEFSKHDLTPLLPQTLRFGQTMKSVLDIMTIEKYLERREGKSDGKPGRIREWFKATDKLTQFIVANPEQA